MKNGWIGRLTVASQAVGGLGAFLLAYRMLEAPALGQKVIGAVLCLWTTLPYVGAAGGRLRK